MQPPPPVFEVLQPELLPRAEGTETTSPEHLDTDHLTSFKTAIDNVLNTGLAEQTFGQILDGLPTKPSFLELHTISKDLGHPAPQHHALCQGAVEQVRQFRSVFDISSLRFDPAALQAYQDSALGSRVFALSLVELVAVACHQIAVFLHQLGGGIHSKGYDSWLAQEQVLFDNGDDKYKYFPLEPPAPFYHDEYYIHEQYPQGVSDMVGYWAETIIFGGVVLFDRSDSDPEAALEVLRPLTSQQFDTVISFLLAEEEVPSCPFPIRGTPENRPRYDPYHAMKYFNIYRNRYERLLPPKLWRRDVFSSNDYPELDDRRDLLIHLYEIGSGEAERDDELVRFYEERLKLISPSSPLWSMGGDYD